MRILGIDPGASGGACLLDGTRIVTAVPYETEGNFVEFIEALGSVSVAFIERVGARPGQGVSSMFKFGYNTGYVRGVIRANKIPVRDVTPQVWQKALGAARGKTKTQHKANLKDLAQQLFPKTKLTLKTCDAVLIAEYGRRLYNEEA